MKRCICGNYPEVFSRLTFLSHLGGLNAKYATEYYVKCLSCGEQTIGYGDDRYANPKQEAEKHWDEMIERHRYIESKCI